MPKKSNTRRADGLISSQIYVGTVDGKRKYKTVYGHTQKEVDEKINLLRLQMRKGIDIASQGDSFGAWKDRWLSIKKTEVGSGSMGMYISSLNHLETLFPISITKITTFDIQAIINSLNIKNPNTKKPTSKKTLKTIIGTISQIFSLAIENRVIDYNPAAYVRLPLSTQANKRHAISEEQRQWIEETPHRAQLASMIMLYAGLRRGELLALTWGDIDITEKTISVNKVVEMKGGKPYLKPFTKTESGMRTIDIPQKLVSFLEQQPRQTLLVFANQHGTYISSSTWDNIWRSYMLDLNMKYGNFDNVLTDVSKNRIPKSKYDPGGVPIVIERFTAHCLRHTFATMLYFAGVDILTAKEQLGHSNIKTTLEIYTHLDKKFKRNSMDKLDSYLSKENNASSVQVVK